MSRKLILKRVENRHHVLALHDAETGEVLTQQVNVDVNNEIDEPLSVTVKFIVDGENIKIIGD